MHRHRVPQLILLAALLVEACSDAREQASKQEPVAGADASSLVAAADASSLAGTTPSEGVLRRSCGRPSFGADWTFEPKSKGITCQSKADCGSDPLLHCFGLPADCAVAASGCKLIATTFCRFDDCANDADCSAGTRCVCPATGGDPWCVTEGCDDDGDCASGQSCRSDDAIRGVGPFQHCSTPDDLCRETSECSDANEACGYDLSFHRWACTAIVTVD